MGNDDDTDNPVQACPGPCDAVIPIVYYNQPITIKYSAIREKMGLFQRAAIDEEGSVKRTFTQPTAHPPLSIAQAGSTSFRVRGLGHAGVAFINGKTGQVSYYEYGRYDQRGYGRVQQPPNMSNASVSFGDDGNPTQESFNSLLRKLTETNGGPYAFWATYTKIANGGYDIMKKFAEDRKQAVNQLKSADAYNIYSNHCFTFALEVAASVGVNADVSAAEDLQVILISAIGTEVSSEGRVDDIELPSRQMLELQSRYRPLNVNSSGSIEGSFTFPEGLNSR